MYRTIAFLLPLLLIFSLPPLAAAQTERIDHITVEDGLSESTILAILQDSKGFLWFGTQNGLNKYDGSRFTVYYHDNDDENSLTTNDIGALHESEPNILWIGTCGGGLNRLDLTTETFTHYRHDPDDPTSLSDDYIYAIAEDDAGDLWITTRNNGFNRFDPVTETFERFTTDSHPISHPRSGPMAIDRFGGVWVGTMDGLDRLDLQTDELTRFHPDAPPERQIGHPALPALLVDSHDMIWVGSAAGVSLISAETQTPLPLPANTPDTLRSAFIWSILEDTNGDIWFATNGDGLFQFMRDSQTFHTYTHDPDDPTSLSNNAIVSLYEDRTGTLWIGSWTAGINRLDPHRYKFTDQIMLDAFVTVIEESPDGKLWAGTPDSTLVQIDRSSDTVARQTYLIDDDNAFIFDIEPAADGGLWIGSFSGVTHFDPATLQSERIELLPESVLARVVLESADSSLWIGTSHGLFVFNPHNNELTTIEAIAEDEQPSGVYALHQDDEQQIWIGSQAGLHTIDPTTRQTVRIPDIDVQGFVSVIHEDRDGDLWIGTWGDGLAHLDRTTGTVTRYDRGIDNIILGILQGANDTLWISTPNDLVHFDMRSEAVRRYNQSDGFLPGGFVQAAYLQTSSGELMFGQDGGILVFDPQTLRDNPHPPPVYLTDFQLFNQSVERESELLNGQHINFIDEITLTHDQSVFSFEFAALGYTNPAQNSYAHKMDGVDPNWNNVGNRNFVTYTNLDPGQYTFRVRAANSDGVWNEEMLTVALTILPPWWQTWWAYAGYGLLAVTAVALLVQVRTRRQARELAHARRVRETLTYAQRVREEDRARIAREMHDGLAQTLAALRFRMRVWNTLLQRTPEQLPEQFDEGVAVLGESIEEVRRSVYALRPIMLEELGFNAAIEQFAALLREQYKLQVHLSLTEQIPTDLEHDAFRIIQELMNNAAQHAAADNLWVQAAVADGQLQLTVRDDGIGFDINKTTPGNHFGLTQLKERIALRNGRHTIRSTSDKGTEVTVLLPLMG